VLTPSQDRSLGILYCIVYSDPLVSFSSPTHHQGCPEDSVHGLLKCRLQNDLVQTRLV